MHLYAENLEKELPPLLFIINTFGLKLIKFIMQIKNKQQHKQNEFKKGQIFQNQIS